MREKIHVTQTKCYVPAISPPPPHIFREELNDQLNLKIPFIFLSVQPALSQMSLCDTKKRYPDYIFKWREYDYNLKEDHGELFRFTQ